MYQSIKLWRVSSDELLYDYPCDRYMEKFHDIYYRGITINASADNVFRWICQLKTAPYSYDWIDNFGRQSPQELIPGLDRLETGQKIMFIFDLIDFEQGKHLTIRVKKALVKFWGDTVISYCIFKECQEKCRLIVKIRVFYPHGFFGMLLRMILPLGDLIMMRRQLLNFKQLSEQTQSRK